jgi:hypothetical protein
MSGFNSIDALAIDQLIMLTEWSMFDSLNITSQQILVQRVIVSKVTAIFAFRFSFELLLVYCNIARVYFMRAIATVITQTCGHMFGTDIADFGTVF